VFLAGKFAANQRRKKIFPLRIQSGSDNPKKINDLIGKPQISSAAETLRDCAATRKT
jgi:hypothetical protein